MATKPCTDAAEQHWPLVAPCDQCHHEVLYARYPASNRVAKLEPMPFIVGTGSCWVCRGTAIKDCPGCEGTGRRGQNLTRKHVVITLHGVVRPGSRLVKPWDSAYHRHTCSP